MQIDHKMVDIVLRDEIAWHRTKVGMKSTGYTKNERCAFIRGLRQSRLLLAKIVKELRLCKNKIS